MSWNAGSVRHLPWTCAWGQFGGPSIVDVCSRDGELRAGEASSPWICLHPEVRPNGRHLRKGDCENCPFWTVPLARPPC
jgi:hypothetical protein